MKTKNEINRWIDQMTDEEKELSFGLYQLAFQSGVVKMGEAVSQILTRLGIQLPMEAIDVFNELMKEEEEHRGRKTN